jgi:2-polyprenyl-3-methyl-5-hydroxy-6-metoxy-1,4-benzoquinol methylase
LKFVRIDPPGQWCTFDAVKEAIGRCGGRTFLEVGCGAGRLSRVLCERGMTGRGIDVSATAVDETSEALREFIDRGAFEVGRADIFSVPESAGCYDLAVSLMVMEHVQDDLGFISRIAHAVKPGGHVIVAVPGRPDLWGIEDETVGHVRRYDRASLSDLLTRAGLRNVHVWSVAVPVANLLFRLGNAMIRLGGETRKKSLSAQQQTEESGIRRIPFKTVFPPVFGLVLNKYTMAPLHAVQRLFYGSDLGLTLLAFGEKRT